MSAMLPFAYSIVLFLSGAVCGFFVWVWYRNSDDASQAEFRWHSQKFRDAIKREQDHSAALQTELSQRTLQLRSVDQLNHQLESKLKKTQTLFLHRDNAMKIATGRGDVTLKLLEEQQAARTELQQELDLARQQLSSVRAEFDLERRREEREKQQAAAAVATQVLLNNAQHETTEQIAPQPVILKVIFDETQSSSSITSDTSFDTVEPVSAAQLSCVDPVLGKLYRSRPADVDDLKQIAGIAETLEQKLHDQGIFTFEQIMHWDQQAIVAFSSLLDTFQDRVERNNWVAQARYLYDRKMGLPETESPAA